MQYFHAMTGQAWQSIAQLTLLMALASTAIAQDDAWSPPALSGEAGELPEGRDIVQQAVNFMESNGRVGFEAVVSYEVIQKNGQKLEFGMLQRVAIERPIKLHWVTLYDNATTDTAWVADGTFTMIRQPANVWGQVRVPPSLPDAVERISEEYDVPVPFVDILTGDASDLWLGDDVEWVDYIGESWADGQWTNHVAIRRPGADVQLWFRKGDQPFLLRMVIVHTDEDGMPAYTARFRKWSAQIPDDAIPKFEPPPGSSEIEIVPVVTP